MNSEIKVTWGSALENGNTQQSMTLDTSQHAEDNNFELLMGIIASLCESKFKVIDSQPDGSLTIQTKLRGNSAEITQQPPNKPLPSERFGSNYAQKKGGRALKLKTLPIRNIAFDMARAVYEAEPGRVSLTTLSSVISEVIEGFESKLSVKLSCLGAYHSGYPSAATIKEWLQSIHVVHPSTMAKIDKNKIKLFLEQKYPAPLIMQKILFSQGVMSQLPAKL